MNRLGDFERELLEASYQGTRWTYVPRAEANRYGLAITVVGRRGKIEVPFDFCNADRFEDITDYADELNRLRSRPAA